MNDTPRLIVGTAGWSIPKASSFAFPSEGTSLSRYASCFNGAEINSTFYRSHRPSTYERWRNSVPNGFRFSVKIPKTISHELRLNGVEQLFYKFIEETSALGEHRGPLLLQCPPSLAFDAQSVTSFLHMARSLFEGQMVVEPRHASWFSDDVDTLFSDYRIARVLADPARFDAADEPGGFDDLVYLRLHGSPHIYFSSYEAWQLGDVVSQLAGYNSERWCIFDNTASGAATANALQLLEIVADT